MAPKKRSKNGKNSLEVDKQLHVKESSEPEREVDVQKSEHESEGSAQPIEPQGAQPSEKIVTAGTETTKRNSRAKRGVCAMHKVVVKKAQGKNFKFRALRTFNSQTGRGNRTPKVQNLAGSPKQPASHECGYVVMRDIILDEDMYSFSTKWLLKTRTSYKIEELEEVRHKTLKHIEKLM
ncbi:hypothetical protein POM88_052233 [Heracleum sosnowskyi]|uniref:Uncharacterized protein n=1 Tax=Heracleum sosnowskyi TaxID=360622 RepID=A0AAD8LZ56_9APIA|nr:hypothetical protein POM88_052233 [Heracleum sosnowskyi]